MKGLLIERRRLPNYCDGYGNVLGEARVQVLALGPLSRQSRLPGKLLVARQLFEVRSGVRSSLDYYERLCRYHQELGLGEFDLRNLQRRDELQRGQSSRLVCRMPNG